MASSSIILQSEHFDRAAGNLANAMQQFPAGDFVDAVNRFERSINRLVQAMGMQAENDYRKACGNQIAYDENAFANL